MNEVLPTGGMRKNLNFGMIHSLRRFIKTRNIGKIGKDVYVGDNVKLMRNPQKIFLGNMVVLNDYVVLCPTYEKATIIIGDWTTLNLYSMIFASSSVEIGKNSLIGPSVYIGDSDHGFDRGELIKKQNISTNPIKIGNNVWIGVGVKILGGVTIGDNSVIGAGSVVTKSIPPNSIAYGVPAKIIKKQ